MTKKLGTAMANHTPYRPMLFDPEAYEHRAPGDPTPRTRDQLVRQLNFMTQSLGQYLRDNNIPTTSRLHTAVGALSEAYRTWQRSPESIDADLALYKAMQGFERSAISESRGLREFGNPISQSIGNMLQDAREIQNNLNERAREQGALFREPLSARPNVDGPTPQIRHAMWQENNNIAIDPVVAKPPQSLTLNDRLHNLSLSTNPHVRAMAEEMKAAQAVLAGTRELQLSNGQFSQTTFSMAPTPIETDSIRAAHRSGHEFRTITDSAPRQIGGIALHMTDIAGRHFSDSVVPNYATIKPDEIKEAYSLLQDITQEAKVTSQREHARAPETGRIQFTAADIPDQFRPQDGLPRHTPERDRVLT